MENSPTEEEQDDSCSKKYQWLRRHGEIVNELREDKKAAVIGKDKFLYKNRK